MAVAAPEAESGAEAPVLDVPAAVAAASLERSAPDPQTLLLVRPAARVAVDAPPLSSPLTLRVAGELGVTAAQVEGVLAAVAPVVGAPRVVAAASTIARAVGLAVSVAAAEVGDPPIGGLRPPAGGRGEAAARAHPGGAGQEGRA